MYRLKVFLLSFVYYFANGNNVFGIVAFILSLALPLNMFYLVSLVESLVFWRLEVSGKIRTRKKKHPIVLGCIWVFLFFGIKLFLMQLITLL